MQSLITAGDSRRADAIFFYAMVACGLSVLAIVFLIVYELVTKSNLSWHAFGLKFFFRSEWDPVNDQYGALPFVYGTIVSSILALIIAVPLAIGVAVYITEMSPRWLRGALAFTTELLAAIPSVIYGLWAIFVLVPLLRQYLEPWLIRTGVLRNARAGIMGGVILGLGRALGETMAVTMVIGNRPEIAKSLFAPGYTMASVIANEFSEATGDLYLSALVEVGLALFIVTIIVNILAQFLVWTVTRGTPARGNA